MKKMTGKIHRNTILILLGGAAFLFLLSFLYFSLSPVDSRHITSTIDIPKGKSFFEIVDILEENGLVRNRPFFYVLAGLKRANRLIRAGEYELASSMSPDEIIDREIEYIARAGAEVLAARRHGDHGLRPQRLEHESQGERATTAGAGRLPRSDQFDGGDALPQEGLGHGRASVASVSTRVTAPRGHSSTQMPQPLQCSSETT